MNGPGARFNQDGDLRPTHSAYGAGLHALAHGRAFRDFPDGSNATGVIGGRHGSVWQFAPLLPDPTYDNLIGGLATRAAKIRPVLGGFDYYDGILPLGQQPDMDKPFPWADTTRGRP